MIVDIETHKPHVVINTVGKAHVIPKSLVEGWISGKEPLPEEDILRRIIEEWFEWLSS